MRLTQEQISQFDKDGFLIFPSLISIAEIQALRAESDRLKLIDCELIKREKSGAIRSIFRTHEDNGPTQSPQFRALSRLPRVLGVAKQLLNDNDLYIFHTKLNLKPAIEGTIWSWHQDYGTWKKDGVPNADMLTTMVMLDEADELGGALYLVPGSHKHGVLDHTEDLSVGALNKYTIRRDLLLKMLDAGRPVPVTGPPGTVAVFHSNLIHGSGHNMSSRDRRQQYVVYNRVANTPKESVRIREDHLSSLNQTPIFEGAEDGIIKAETIF